MLGWVRALAVAAGVSAAFPAAAAATVTITFTPPAGAHVSTEDTPPHYFRTTNTQPVIGLSADGGTQLRCVLGTDYSFPGFSQAVPCGPPLPGCTAVVCASWRPTAPLKGTPASDYTLQVEAVDSTNSPLREDQQGFAVDLTPPKVKYYGTSVINSLRPTFDFVVADDQPSSGFITVTDTTSCSFGALRAPLRWQPCPPSATQDAGATYHLPARHVDYRLWIRGVDDFGRATVIHRDYDPVPCAVHASPPRRLRDVALSGVPLRVSCSYVRGVELGIWPVAVNGHVYAHSPAQTVSTRLLLGGLRVRGHGNHWSARRRLHMSSQFVTQALRFHSTRFLLTACPDWPAHENPCAGRSLDTSWSYLSFTSS